ncbi:MAG: DNA repair protein RadC [Sulfuritalea sp.]|nr:DNA repair protein RadC [Sulfuritalea sp.]
MNFNKKELDVIARAMAILEERAHYNSIALASPGAVTDYLRLRVGGLEHEVFGVLWLDAQNRLIEAEELFRGTLTQASVYPREVVKTALARNAAPGPPPPPPPPRRGAPPPPPGCLTGTLKTALALVDVRVVDHFVVTAGAAMSFAERGLI